jgi:hypothetical protein
MPCQCHRPLRSAALHCSSDEAKGDLLIQRERSRACEENIRKKSVTKAAPWCLERAIKEAFDGGPVDCAPLLVLVAVTVSRKSKELAR